MKRYFLTRAGEIIAGPFATVAQVRKAELDLCERGTITQLVWIGAR